MNTKIWKYEILPNSVRDGQYPIEVTAPRGARPLHVALQHGIPCLWMEVDPDQPKVRQTVLLCVGTGFGSVPTEYDDPGTPGIAVPRWRYFASLQEGSFVWHLYARNQG